MAAPRKAIKALDAGTFVAALEDPETPLDTLRQMASAFKFADSAGQLHIIFSYVERMRKAGCLSDEIPKIQAKTPAANMALVQAAADNGDIALLKKVHAGMSTRDRKAFAFTATEAGSVAGIFEHCGADAMNWAWDTFELTTEKMKQRKETNKSKFVATPYYTAMGKSGNFETLEWFRSKGLLSPDDPELHMHLDNAIQGAAIGNHRDLALALLAENVTPAHREVLAQTFIGGLVMCGHLDSVAWALKPESYVELGVDRLPDVGRTLDEFRMHPACLLFYINTKHDDAYLMATLLNQVLNIFPTHAFTTDHLTCLGKAIEHENNDLIKFLSDDLQARFDMGAMHFRHPQPSPSVLAAMRYMRDLPAQPNNPRT